MTDCPRPDKYRYLTRREARHEARIVNSIGHHVREYRCQCGYWHLGHATADTREAIRLARHGEVAS
jgi:hypothetical protein